MDLDNFRKMVAPGGKNSRLAPFWPEIKALRADNYTLDQVLEFLKANGVEITITGLSKYIQRRHEKEGIGGTPKIAIQTKPPNTALPKEKPSTGETGPTSDEQSGLTLKQKGERVADKFVKDAPNPLLKRIKD